MARCKVRLVRIANDAIRRATLKKRLKGLMKKVRELTVLCDVEAAVVVYDPQHYPLAPAVWPSRRGADLTFRRFRDLPEIQRRRKVSSHETFLLERVAKLREQLRRLQRGNRELEMSVFLLEGLSGRSLGDVSIEDASSLLQVIDNKLREITSRREEVVRQFAITPPPPPPPPPEAVPTLIPIPLQQSMNWPPLPPPPAIPTLMPPPLRQSMMNWPLLPLPPPPPAARMPSQRNIHWSSFSDTITLPSIQSPAPAGSHSHAAAGNLQIMEEYSGATMNPFPWSDSLFF